MKVTAKNVFTLPDGRYSVSENLTLRVRGSSRSYVFRFMAGGIRKDKTLGTAGKLTLTEAKRLADAMRVGMAKGEIPATPREELAAKTAEDVCPVFRIFAEKTFEKIASVKVWKDANHGRNWIDSVRTYAYPTVGDKRVSEIKKQDILRILKPIWISKNDTASKVRRRMENLLAYAVAEGYLEYNPATWRGNLDMELPPPSKVKTVKHMEAMPFGVLQEKISCFLPADTRTKRVILFTILTCSRVGESAPAKWDEIDWENRVWSVPPERRKDGKPHPHRVPLSDQVIELLKGVKRESEYIFPFKGAPGSKYSLRVLMQRLTGTTATMHGFRSTFRDWAAENQKDHVTSEKCLMHSTGNAVVQAYQRSDLLEPRRKLMQEWADAVFEKHPFTWD